MENQELFFAARHISGYVSYDICNDTITNGLVKTFVSYTIQKTNLSAVDYYLSWLEKEIDDGTAMKYLQKPSPELSDDTVVAVFYTNVWNLLAGRINIDKIVMELFNRQKITKNNPLCIKKRFSYRLDYQLVEISDDYFKQIKKRAFDQNLVELIHFADKKIPDDTVVAKIYGDIWKNGPLFRLFPDEY